MLLISFLILIENDLKWIDNGTGGLVSDGDNKALVDDAELTILVLEKVKESDIMADWKTKNKIKKTQMVENSRE